MKTGQLVRRRFFTGAERRRFAHTGRNPGEVGLIVMLPWQGAKSDNIWVLFPSKTRPMLHQQARLEVVDESR